MPYVITTSKPCPEGHTEPVMQGDGHGWDGTSMHTPPCETCDDRCEMLTRRAVATREEAQAEQDRLLAEHGHKGGFVLATGTVRVGPLPDGTVIEVEPMTWDAMYAAHADAAGRTPVSHPEILADFNAREAGA